MFKDYLCSPEANVYGIDFTRFKLRDMDSGAVLFEVAKPPPPGLFMLFMMQFSKCWTVCSLLHVLSLLTLYKNSYFASSFCRRLGIWYRTRWCRPSRREIRTLSVYTTVPKAKNSRSNVSQWTQLKVFCLLIVDTH